MTRDRYQGPDGAFRYMLDRYWRRRACRDGHDFGPWMGIDYHWERRECSCCHWTETRWRYGPT